MRRLPTSLLFLCLAWFCAQQPQGVVVDIVHWLRNAARFSHQQTLVQDLRLALALAAQPQDEAMQLAGADAPTSSDASAVPVPEVVTGKMPLALVQGTEVIAPCATRGRMIDEPRFARAGAGDVPTPVPRRLG